VTRRGRISALRRRWQQRGASQTPLLLPIRHLVRAQIPAFLELRTKREHFLDRLRRLPNRNDIHDLELRLGERMDSLAVRFDRALDPHFSR
jgi:hypothetical protein